MRIINTDEQDKSGRRLFRPKAEDSPLLLSNAAQERIYSTTSILTHHHSTQFLTFSPPFNSHVPLTEQSNDETSSNISSLGMGSHYQGGLVDDLMKSLKAKSREQQFTPSTEKAQAEHSTNGDLLYPSITFEEPDLSSIMNLNQLMRFSRDDSSSSIRSRRNASGVISHLNCWKTRERVAALACCPSPPNFEIQEMTLNCCKARDMNHTLLASVAEEKYKVEEEKCNVLDVRPVPEDSGRQEYGSKISAPSLSGIDTDSSIFYVMRGNTRIRLMEI